MRYHVEIADRYDTTYAARWLVRILRGAVLVGLGCDSTARGELRRALAEVRLRRRSGTLAEATNDRG